MYELKRITIANYLIKQSKLTKYIDFHDGDGFLEYRKKQCEKNFDLVGSRYRKDLGTRGSPRQINFMQACIN